MSTEGTACKHNRKERSQLCWASQVAQWSQVQSLGQEDPLKWQPTPVFLPGESPWTEEPGGGHSVSKTEQVSMHSYVILMLKLPWKTAFKKKTKLQNQPRTEKLYHHLVSM